MARGTRTHDAPLTAPGAWAPRAAVGLAALALGPLAGCGSATVAELPPPARPDASPATSVPPAGRVTTAPAAPLEALSRPALQPRTTLRDETLELSVQGRARTVQLTDRRLRRVVAEATAGVGPTNVACSPEGPCFVVDTQGDALLVFRVGADDRSLRLTRRVYLDGAPFGIAVDQERGRLWITLTARNEVVELGAHGRPHILQRLPTVRQPDRVTVDERSGDVTIVGAAGALQTIEDPATPDS